MKQLYKSISSKFEMASPASTAAIEEAEHYFDVQFPEDYKELLKFTNGMEGEISGKYLVLWSAEELIELNQAYNVKEFITNVIIFGSDGAEDAFAFYSSDSGSSIIRLPFIGMGHIAPEKLSDIFEEFLESQIKEDSGFFKRIFR